METPILEHSEKVETFLYGPPLSIPLPLTGKRTEVHDKHYKNNNIFG